MYLHIYINYVSLFGRIGRKPGQSSGRTLLFGDFLKVQRSLLPLQFRLSE